MENEAVISQIRNGLIVSCQALEGEMLYREEGGIMPLMAKAAAQGGAVGIRANSVRDIRQIREVTDLPMIGIIKKQYPGSRVYITATMAEVDALVETGVEIIALDGTETVRPDGSTPDVFIRQIREKYPDQLLMADIARLEEGELCAQAGVDFVGTTLCGYTPETAGIEGPSLDLIRALKAHIQVRVIAEGQIHDPYLAKACLDAGAFAIVVGGAITRPAEITARFVRAIR